MRREDGGGSFSQSRRVEFLQEKVKTECLTDTRCQSKNRTDLLIEQKVCVMKQNEHMEPQRIKTTITESENVSVSEHVEMFL